MHYLKVTRKSFLESLGLGVGAYFLNPFAGKLISEALGQSLTPKPRLIIGVLGEAFGNCFHPPEFSRDPGTTPLTSQFSIPDCFSPLARFKDNTLMLSKLRLPGTTGEVHGQNWGTLSSKVALSSPVQATFDHVMAEHLRGGAPMSAVRFGYTEDNNDGSSYKEKSSIFARGSGQSISHITKFAPLKNMLFTGAAPISSTEGVSRSSMFSFLREDANKLKNKLAVSERPKVDAYVEGIVDFEKTLGSGSCDPGTLNTTFAKQEDEFLEMAKMAAFAMKCGLANVSAFGVATEGVGHGSYPKFSFIKSGGQDAHATSKYAGNYHPNMMRVMAQALDIMIRTIAGGTGLPEDLTVILIPSNGIGDYHHGNKSDFPVFMISSHRNLKVGYYRVYPSKTISLGAFYTTVARAHGLTLGGFGDYTGSGLSELLV